MEPQGRFSSREGVSEGLQRAGGGERPLDYYILQLPRPVDTRRSFGTARSPAGTLQGRSGDAGQRPEPCSWQQS